MVGQRDWWSRLAAIAYAWTLGLVVGVIVVTLGLTYAFIGSFMKLFGVGNQADLPLWKPIKTTFQWWFGLHDHAISGTGVWDPAPPILD